MKQLVSFLLDHMKRLSETGDLLGGGKWCGWSISRRCGQCWTRGGVFGRIERRRSAR
jgi:hypothetical protein